MVYNQSGKNIDEFDDIQADFGPLLPYNGIKGYVVLANPVHACQQIQPPPNITNHTETYTFWIALIQRVKPTPGGNGSCNFDQKVINAQKYFNAVIIYNYEDKMIKMSAGGSGKVLIPAVAISKSDGLTIINQYVHNKSSSHTPLYYIIITPDQTFNLTYYLIPFAAIVGICLFGLCSFVLVKCYLHRRRERRHRLPRSALKQLKVKKFQKGDPYDVCAICLDDYEDGAKLRILPCDHAYHMKCIDPWLLNNRRQCPICKRYVFPNRDQDSEDESDHRPTEQTPLLGATAEPNNGSTPRARFNTTVEEHDSNHQQQQRRIQRTSGDSHGIYGSVQSSSFTTPHAANFFLDSLGDQNTSDLSQSHSYPNTAPINQGTRTTPYMNISVKSVDEMSSSDEHSNDDNMHSVVSDTTQINQGYLDDYDVENTTLRTIV
ncbi:unnamed protein product [Didymodactylos carnosus]|uniref:RING-type domain-containing protein n=1 Tax=Didymodactylos carnosus TaxID=1234261 RepID=A0A813RW96_9BILA|nr:unnamed protein product [Didymodactylos carnosus]CAF1056250.1 unnamed protein product [Didymodactylos carnosus]CAF3569781.1 unnamed protein product [Didymodactylos carnosus]CAF3822424.1 unnamed protein product [Didymodactylos carnosus]